MLVIRLWYLWLIWLKLVTVVVQSLGLMILINFMWALKVQGLILAPVAYGKGGTAPTTTDANLALGRINPEFFCGGELKADMASVQTSLEKIAAPMGISTQDVARGIVRIANNNV